MRRTASLDAIYHKGQWPKDDQQPFSHLLNVDKASQTPEEWASSCYRGISGNWTTYEEAYHSSSNSSSNNSSNNSSRRPSVTPSPLLNIAHQNPPASGEQIDKFIRQRLRTNKDGPSGSSGLRYSPLPGDHSVPTPSPVHPRHHALQQTNGGSRGIPIPQLPKPLLPPRLRSSVEGLNQEIERLVLRPSQASGEDVDDWTGEVARDGRRAPVAEYLRFTRSIDTQTPAQGSTVSGTSSNHTSPSISPPTSPPQSRNLIRPPSTPSPTGAHPLATSPHINKFVSRAPPDGCERVATKQHDIHRPEASKPCADWPAMRPPGVTLLPSQGSAFVTPGRIGEGEVEGEDEDEEEDEEVCRATASHVCQHHTDSFSETCTMCGSVGGAVGGSAEQYHEGPISQVCQASSQTCDVGVSTMTAASLATSSHLTADQ